MTTVWRRGESYGRTGPAARQVVLAALVGGGDLPVGRLAAYPGAGPARGVADPRSAGVGGGGDRRATPAAAVRPLRRGVRRPAGPAPHDGRGGRRPGRADRRLRGAGGHRPGRRRRAGRLRVRARHARDPVRRLRVRHPAGHRPRRPVAGGQRPTAGRHGGGRRFRRGADRGGVVRAGRRDPVRRRRGLVRRGRPAGPDSLHRHTAGLPTRLVAGRRPRGGPAHGGRPGRAEAAVGVAGGR